MLDVPNTRLLPILLAPLLVALSLPAPSGPHVVGTSVAYLIDSSRADADFRDGRPITVQLPLIVASVAGTGHFSFSDGPFVMPTTITRFGGRIIDGTLGWQIITQSMRAFFDEALRKSGGGVATLAKRYPQLSVTTFGTAPR